MSSKYEERVMDGKLWARKSSSERWSLVPYHVVMGRMLLAEQQVMNAIQAATKKESGPRTYYKPHEFL